VKLAAGMFAVMNIGGGGDANFLLSHVLTVNESSMGTGRKRRVNVKLVEHSGV